MLGGSGIDTHTKTDPTRQLISYVLHVCTIRSILWLNGMLYQFTMIYLIDILFVEI